MGRGPGKGVTWGNLPEDREVCMYVCMYVCFNMYGIIKLVYYINYSTFY